VLAAAVIAATIAAGCSGCSRGTSVLPGDIRSYTVSKQAEPAPIAASPGDVPTKPAPVRYDVPEGWTDGGASGIRLATLLIGDPAGQREVTIIPASGTLEGNVARWQGQLDAGGDPDDLASRAAAAIEAAESVDVDGRPAKVVLLRDAAAGQAILGYFGAAGAMATACPAGSYCEAGTERPVACPSGTQSAELANDLTDCVSSPGFYGPNGTPRAPNTHPCAAPP
jgi:hypothetical protein